MWDELIIRPFLNSLLYIYNLIGGNFGLAIILFTILIRALTYPLMASQIKGTQGMQKLQTDKRWIEMQEKYKNDKEKLAQEQMKLYKELGINPFASCLPTLIQFPIIIGLYQAIIRALANSPVELLDMIQKMYPGWFNLASLIPLNSNFLWMNLGEPERLHIPGLPFGIPVLAILVVITTYLQSKLMSPGAAAGGKNDQTAMMGNMMNIYMPFLMGYMAFSFASGLSLYFVTSNLLGVAQYAIMGKLNWKNLLPTPKADKPTGKKTK